jgi:hypothetical protein
MMMTLYIYHVYDDLRKSLGVVLPADSAISPLPQTTVELSSPVYSRHRSYPLSLKCSSKHGRSFRRDFSA